MSSNIENYGKHTTTKSVSKTLAILSTFTEMSPMQRTSDIAEALDMNISTVSRHLNTLLDWGFLERDDVTGYYYPGLAVITLAGISLQSNNVFRFASPELQQLSYKHHVHSHMATPHKTDIIHMVNCSSEHTKELMMPMGHHHPMFCSAMGRAILAYMPHEQVMDILKNSDIRPFTSETKVEISDILDELKKVKQRGYCLVINELNENKASLAAPIFNRFREPVAAISVSASASKMSQPDYEHDMAKIVMDTANKISGHLGYFPR